MAISILTIYQTLTSRARPALLRLLRKRLALGKEMPDRVREREGFASLPRPVGWLAHIHAASVGEAQSAMILIEAVLKACPDGHILVTTGTVTSARLMARKLPPRAFHQFAPWDCPEWVTRFLDYWRPDLSISIESELWPNMLLAIKARAIPAALVNARLSDRSWRRWRLIPGTAKRMLSALQLVIAQTPEDARRFKALGAEAAYALDNLKYAANPLPCDENDFLKLSDALGGRRRWLFASSHAGEEAMACRVHRRLKLDIPDLLTVIVPRHPDRRGHLGIDKDAKDIKVLFRGESKELPAGDADIYIADTLGELGLFYRLSPVACIGRSFSADGGGGHNPIEAAQLRCAVLHGPKVQFQQAIYDDMHAENAAMAAVNEHALANELRCLLTDPDYLADRRAAAFEFAQGKSKILERLMEALEPLIRQEERIA